MKRNDIQTIKFSLTEQLQILKQNPPSKVARSDGYEERCAEIVDQASQAAEKDLLIKFRSLQGRMMLEIEEALDRIAKGDYGICDTCAAKISLDRLKAQPFASKCIKCQAASEKSFQQTAHY